MRNQPLEAIYLQDDNLSSEKFNSANKIIDRLKTALDVERDFQLAEILDVEPSTLSNWKRRDSVDYERILAKCKDVDFNWLFGSDNGPIEMENSLSTPMVKEPGEWSSSQKDDEKESLRLENHALRARLEVLEEMYEKLVRALAATRSGREVGFTETEEGEREKERAS